MRIERGLTPAEAPGAARPQGSGSGFETVLRQSRQALRISAHAAERLRQAGADPGHVQSAADAVGRAAAKGGRSTLVLLNGLALVVDVPTRTVVTAVSAERMKERVFTQIDSAVIG